MAVSSFPFDSQTTTETQYSKLFREAVADGVVRAGLTVSANSTGLQVLVSPGLGTVRGHCIISDAVIPLSIAPPTGGARVDTVVARLDPSVNSIVIAVVQGTPGGGPPELTRTDAGVYEMPLGDVEVGTGVATIASTAVTDRRSGLSGGVGSWTTAGRPLAPRLGRFGFNTDLDRWEGWSGVAWEMLGGPTKTRWVTRRTASPNASDFYGGNSTFESLVQVNVPASAPAGLYKITSQLAASGRNGRSGIGYLRTTAGPVTGSEVNTTADHRLDVFGVSVVQSAISEYAHDGTSGFIVRMAHRSAVPASVQNTATLVEVLYVGPAPL